jgi:hypothetical protein
MAALTAWGAQAGLNDGFADNEPFKWKIWDSSDGIAYDALATWNIVQFPNEGSFVSNGMSGLSSLTAISSQVQEISLPAGWSILSTYLIPFTPDAEDVFSGVISNLALVKDGEGQVYWPPFIDQINSLVPGKGYQIKMINADTLFIDGVQIVPENTPVQVPQGWSIIGYLRNNPGNLEQMLSAILPQILLVKDGAGQVYWPPFVNGIGNLYPGKGYQVNMSAPGILIYPQN